MIDFLEGQKLINSPLSLYKIGRYTKFMESVKTYMEEIPANFMSLEFDKNKRDKIRIHLEKIYPSASVTNEKIDIVLLRVLNLIKYVSAGNRGSYKEDFVGQQNFIQQNWSKIKRCQCCGKKFLKREDASLEHVLPISLGGNDDNRNWQLLCHQCNGDKSNHFGMNDYQWLKPIETFKLFGKSFEDQFDAFKIKKKAKSGNQEKGNIALRYFILERDNRSCTDCVNNVATSELFACAINTESMLSLDSFRTLCEKCVTTRKIDKKFKL